MNIIEFNNVTKNVYNFKLKPTYIKMKKGEILGIVGKPGSGKTTLLKLLLNFYRPKTGDITVFGMDSIRDSKEIKKNIGVIPQSNWFDNSARPMALLKNTLRTRRTKNNGEIDFLIDYFEMKLANKIGNLSPLDRRKLAVINGLVSNSELIILDEPESITDSKSRVKLYDILEEKNREGASILISTSNLKEAQSICDNIYYLHNREIIEEEDQSNKLSNDKILKYYDKDVDKGIFTGIGAKLVRSGNETVFYYNSSLDLLAEAIYKSGLIDFSVEDSTLNEKLTIIEKDIVLGTDKNEEIIFEKSENKKPDEPSSYIVESKVEGSTIVIKSEDMEEAQEARNVDTN
ncbi:MAG: ATP-binding cassette domain-containing protein [Tissierellia bacterium]|nr:ATP-binding cassette domain-containing protein [Tissierellia bacterium]